MELLPQDTVETQGFEEENTNEYLYSRHTENFVNWTLVVEGCWEYLNLEGKHSEINKIAGRQDGSCFYSFYSYSEVHYFKGTKVDTERNNNLKKKKEKTEENIWQAVEERRKYKREEKQW